MGRDFNRIIKREGGAILVIVLFVISIVMLVCIAFLDMSTSEVLMGDYFKDSVQAFYIADGGLQKTLSMLKTDPNFSKGDQWARFLNTSHELGAGSYTISIDEIGNGKIKILSVGTVHKSVVHIEAEVLLATTNPIFYNVISSDSDLKLSDGSLIYGDIYVNGKLHLEGTSEVYGYVRVTQNVTGKQYVQGRIMEDVENLKFPSFNRMQYMNIAVKQGNYLAEDLICDQLYLSGIVFVEGDVFVNTIFGDGLLYATGDILVRDGQVSGGSSCQSLIISEGCFEIDNQLSEQKAQVNAGVFCRDFECPGDVSVLGFIAAQRILVAGNLQISYDDSLIKTQGHLFPDPLSDEVEIIVLNYREINPGYPEPN